MTKQLIEYFASKTAPNSLPITALKEYEDFINWSSFCKWASSDILETFEHVIDWKAASVNKNLTFDLIKRHQNELDWTVISLWASSDILEKFSKLINFDVCSYNTNLTVEFIEKHKSNLTYTQNIENILLSYLC